MDPDSVSGIVKGGEDGGSRGQTHHPQQAKNLRSRRVAEIPAAVEKRPLMAPSSGLSVLTKALHAATAPEPRSTDPSPASAAPRPTMMTSSTSTSSISHTASEFGRHLKRALQDEWSRSPSDSRPPLRPSSCSQTSYATATEGSSSADHPSTAAPPRRPPPPPPPVTSQHESSAFAPPSGRPPGPASALQQQHHEKPSLLRRSSTGMTGKSVEEQEAEQVEQAMRDSLRDEQPRTGQNNGDEADLKRALALSEAEERHRRDEDAARERADFARALAASRRSPTPTSSVQGYDRPTPTNSRPHSPSAALPAFSDTDSAPSGYLPEKSLHHPQGRPMLPPGAGAAWDDEMREMEMLALAIRISQEEEEERKRIEESQLGEALRRSETDATIASDSSTTSTLAPRIGPAGAGPSSPTSSSDESTAVAAAPRSRRSSWIQPPLASSMARQPSASSLDEAGNAASHEPVPPARPPRPFLPPPDKAIGTQATQDGSTSAEKVPHASTERPRVPIPLRPPPPKPRRAAPLPPGAAGSAASSPSSPRLASLPRFSASSADELWRREHDGSPHEMPNLTPSSSIRGHGPLFDRDSHSGLAATPADTASFAGAHLDRRASQASSRSYATAPSELHSTSTEDSDDVPLSPLSIRNPDLRAATPSDDSRSSTLSSSTGSMSPRLDYQHDPARDGHEQNFDPMGPIGMSSYAGRSMSAISELTEPISTAAATEDGPSGRRRASNGSLSRADSFPSTVSIESEGAHSLIGSSALVNDGTESGRQLDEEIDNTPRTSATPFLPTGHPGLARLEPAPMTTPPSGNASGHSSTIRPQRDSRANLGVALATHGDGLRCGYPAECARDLEHVCPADGLSAHNSIPETVELASDLPPNHTSWAIEAHSWVALVRALMWYGDTVVCAASEDLAESPSSRCAATAALEFRSDDGGIPIMRLVLTLLPPKDPASHEAVHRELRVYKAPQKPSKGKGKARAEPATASTAFLLPDVIHLPARLSSLAIQLYSLRHLASIARATQPSEPLPTKGPSHAEGYAALRELADAIAVLAQAAQSRRNNEPSSTTSAGAGRVYTDPQESTGGAGEGSDQNQRLVDRLRSRLRGLKRNRGDRSTDAESENDQAAGDRPSRAPNRLVKPPPAGAQILGRRDRSHSLARDEQLSASASLPQSRIAGGGHGDDMRYMPVL